MDHNHGGLVQIIFLSKWVICRFQPLIFQGVIRPAISWETWHWGEYLIASTSRFGLLNGEPFEVQSGDGRLFTARLASLAIRLY